MWKGITYKYKFLATFSSFNAFDTICFSAKFLFLFNINSSLNQSNLIILFLLEPISDQFGQSNKYWFCFCILDVFHTQTWLLSQGVPTNNPKKQTSLFCGFMHKLKEFEWKISSKMWLVSKIDGIEIRQTSNSHFY